MMKLRPGEVKSLEQGDYSRLLHCSLLCKQIIHTVQPIATWLWCLPAGWVTSLSALAMCLALISGVWMNVIYTGLEEALRAIACVDEPPVLSLGQENSSPKLGLLLPPGSQTKRPWSRTVAMTHSPWTCNVSEEYVCQCKSLGFGDCLLLKQSSKWGSQDPNLSSYNLNAIKFTSFNCTMIFSIAKCNYHHNLTLEHFHHPQKKPSGLFPFLTPSPTELCNT